jgi:transcription termination/antitermination protein NusG
MQDRRLLRNPVESGANQDGRTYANRPDGGAEGADREPIAGGGRRAYPERSSGNRWYAVHTHPHREPRAARHLAYQGFGVCLPQRFKTRRHGRRMDTVLAAYFPQYLFVEFDIERDRWNAVNSTIGVRHLVMRGNLPEPVPHDLISNLIARTDAAGILCLRENLEYGKPVEVTGGPLADLVGTFETMTASHRVRVLLDILGGVTLTLPRNNVAPVSR